MDILDSKEINNRVKLRSKIILILVNSYLAFVTYGISLLLFGITAFITWKIYAKEIEIAISNNNKFKKVFPLRYFGVSYGDFEHVFYYEENIEKEIFEAISKDLAKKANLTNIEKITIIDIDKNLKSPDERTFIRLDSESTKRGTNINLIFRTVSYGKMQSVRWWALAGGYIDEDKKFNKIAYSLFTLPFWIIPYIKKEYDVLSGVRTIYPAYYNNMDVETKIKCIHEIVFEAMLRELEKYDIDTSSLRAQKMQVMNISISGGKVNMGNVVQGAMNRVAGNVGGNQT